MPQLDKFIFIEHSFYVTISFFILYLWASKTLLPNLLLISKTRKKLLQQYEQILINKKKIHGDFIINYNHKAKNRNQFLIDILKHSLRYLPQLTLKDFINYVKTTK